MLVVALVVLGVVLVSVENWHHVQRLPVLLDKYHNAAHEWPVFTKALTSLVAYALGDVIAQALTAFDKFLDTGRFLRCSVAGLILHGPALHYWTFALENGFEMIGWPRGAWYTLAGKVYSGFCFSCLLRCAPYFVN